MIVAATSVIIRQRVKCVMFSVSGYDGMTMAFATGKLSALLLGSNIVYVMRCRDTKKKQLRTSTGEVIWQPNHCATFQTTMRLPKPLRAMSHGPIAMKQVAVLDYSAHLHRLAVRNPDGTMIASIRAFQHS